MKGSNKSRNPLQRDKDRTREVELYLKGWSQDAIAREVGISQNVVSLDLAAVRAEWREQRREDIDEARDDLLQQVRQVKREAWDAWNRSVGKRDVTVNELVTGGEAGRKTRQQVRSNLSAGDAQHLFSVRWAIEAEAELRGLRTSGKAPISGTGPMFSVEDLAKLRREQAEYLKTRGNGKPLPVQSRKMGGLMVLGNPQRKLNGIGSGKTE